MTRPRGGYIGFNRVPAASAVNSAASGVWTLREAEAAKRAGTWPSAPPGGVGAELQLWLDAADSATLFDATTGGSLVAADGGVARWEDKSGNARHATQGTSANRPARKTAIQAGLDVLRFDGSNDSLSIPSSTATFNFMHNGDHTLFIVYKAGTTANPNAIYFLIANGVSGDSIDSQTGFYLRWDDRSTVPFQDQTIYVIANAGGARFVGVSSADTFPANVFNLQTVVGNPQDSTIANRATTRRNGGAALSLSTGDTNAGTALPTGNATQDLRIGATAGTSTSFLNGDIAEIIIYDSALSDADREAVENYLLAKWAIA